MKKIKYILLIVIFILSIFTFYYKIGADSGWDTSYDSDWGSSYDSDYSYRSRGDYSKRI